MSGSGEPSGSALVRELTLPIGDGTLRVAGQLWRPASGALPRARILAVHGTLDNCASFEPLARRLAAAGYCVFAMDLTGHGRSDWHPGGFYHPTAWALEILQTLVALGSEWVNGAQPLVLMGHSLGAALSVELAGAFPERFGAAILIDGLGWGSQPERDGGPDFWAAVSCTRRAIESIVTLDDKRAQGKKEYASVAAAVQARIEATESTSAGQRISLAAASGIVGRGTGTLPGGRVTFAHDSRLTSCTRNTIRSLEDELSYLRRLPRTLILHADARHTYPGLLESTAARLPHLDAARVEVHFFPGEGHHLHADSPDRLLQTVLAFLASLQTPSGPPASRL